MNEYEKKKVQSSLCQLGIQFKFKYIPFFTSSLHFNSNMSKRKERLSYHSRNFVVHDFISFDDKNK